MPVLKSGDARIHYALEGQSGRPILVFSNSLGTNYSMWDPQVHEFRKKFRSLRYDTRGHGQSSSTPGPYSIEQLGKDVIALLDALDLGPAWMRTVRDLSYRDRKSTRLNSSHSQISYAVFCL